MQTFLQFIAVFHLTSVPCTVLESDRIAVKLAFANALLNMTLKTFVWTRKVKKKSEKWSSFILLCGLIMVSQNTPLPCWPSGGVSERTTRLMLDPWLYTAGKARSWTELLRAIQTPGNSAPWKFPPWEFPAKSAPFNSIKAATTKLWWQIGRPKLFPLRSVD